MSDENKMKSSASREAVFNLHKDRFGRKTAKEMLDQVYREREGKKFILVQKGPNTWVEKEVINGKD